MNIIFHPDSIRKNNKLLKELLTSKHSGPNEKTPGTCWEEFSTNKACFAKAKACVKDNTDKLQAIKPSKIRTVIQQTVTEIRNIHII